jgi:hypothetical protein
VLTVVERLFGDARNIEQQVARLMHEHKKRLEHLSIVGAIFKPLLDESILAISTLQDALGLASPISAQWQALPGRSQALQAAHDCPRD